jgi:transglutaminase-like putative cysteine protease
MKLAIEHETVYRYDAPVRSSTQYIRLTPRETPSLNVRQWQIDTPRAATQTQDGYGNVLHVLTLDKPVREIRIRAHGVVETTQLPEGKPEPAAKLSPLVFLRSTTLTRPDESLVAFAEGFRRKSGVLTGLRELAAAVISKLPDDKEEFAETLTAAEAFANGDGSVRNQAHVFIACCRHLGIPARYVSGYVVSHTEGAESIHGHAWVETWLADRWRSFDLAAAHGRSRPADIEHLVLAIGADYHDACPIRGIRTGGGLETMEAISRLVVGH